jgi:hypothetical protein
MNVWYFGIYRAFMSLSAIWFLYDFHRKQIGMGIKRMNIVIVYARSEQKIEIFRTGIYFFPLLYKYIYIKAMNIYCSI